jgi:hypothetical protein
MGMAWHGNPGAGIDGTRRGKSHSKKELSCVEEVIISGYN